MVERGVPREELPPPVDALGNVLVADGAKYPRTGYSERDAAHPVASR